MATEAEGQDPPSTAAGTQEPPAAEESRRGVASEAEGQDPPSTAAGTQEPPAAEESRRSVATEAVVEPRAVSEGQVLSNFFYKNKLAHGHLRALEVMPEVSEVPEGLRRELLDGVGPASMSLTVR